MNLPRALHLLLVDDDTLIHQSLKLTLPKEWHLYGVQKPEDVPYDKFFHAAFVDMHLFKDTSNPVGLKVVAELTKRQPQLEIVAISGDLDRTLMEQGLKAGAQRFLAKPLMPEEVQMVLDKIAAHWNLRLMEKSDFGSPFKWVGQSQVSKSILKQIAALRGETRPILIEGETGTGKEVVARLLHQQEGPRPFVSINMASLPEALFESEMFGHIKGAFTGAETNKIGLVEAAHGGDLFLDEIEALSLTNQAKLLRFLESGEIRKVGGKDNLKIQTRVISASNKILEKMVSDKEFREDLLFRLISQRLVLPPLRDRREDIPELAEYFLASEKPKRNKSFTADGIKELQRYRWPGNVRELKRICEQLSLTSPLPLIRAEDMESLLRPSASVNPETHAKTDLDLNLGLTALVAGFETEVIRRALKEESSVEQAAERLKVSRSNLYKKMKDYNLDGDSST